MAAPAQSGCTCTGPQVTVIGSTTRNVFAVGGGKPSDLIGVRSKSGTVDRNLFIVKGGAGKRNHGAVLMQNQRQRKILRIGLGENRRCVAGHRYRTTDIGLTD